MSEELATIGGARIEKKQRGGATPAALRVLHFASGDAWGGAERVIETLIGASIPRIEVQALLLNEGRLADVLRSMSVPICVISESDRSFFELWRNVRSHLRRHDYDVVHCHRYKELLLAVLALGFGCGRVVVTIHGLEPRIQLTVRQFVRIWAPLFLGRLSGVKFAAVSHELVTRLSRWPISVRAALIPNPIPSVGSGNGLPDLRKRFGWDRNRPLVGFIGRLEHVKGPDLFMEIVKRGPPNAAYVIVGTGSMEELLRTQCEEEGLVDRLQFLGMVPEAAPLLRQFDLLAMTSRHEGTPMALLEAAACDVAVLAFGVGGIPALLARAPKSWCVPPGDVDAFARILHELLLNRDQARRDAMAWAASIRLGYEQAAVLERYRDLYAHCLTPRPQRAVGHGTY